MLRYDPTLPPQRRRLFVHHGGRLVAEATLVDSYANAHVRRADLRLDPSGADEQDAAGALVARSSAAPDDPLPPAAASLAASRVAVPAADRSQEDSE